MYSWQLTAYIRSFHVSGIKVASGFRDNPQKGLPFVTALIVLNEPETGYQLAVMDGTYITNLRTGASAALAAKYLLSKPEVTLGLIGAGTQGRMVIKAIQQLLSIKQAFIYDISRGRASPISSLGRQVGQRTPVTESIIALSSAVTGTDYGAMGLSVAALGIERMGTDEIRRLAAEG